jgi:hypothetical protein
MRYFRSCISLMSTPFVSSFIDNPKPMIRKATAPFENVELFDQYVFAKNVQPAFLRESELKHGRLAMIAAVWLPLSEQVSDKLGIHFFQDNPQFVAPSLALMFTSEFASMFKGWENPLDKPFTLKQEYQPGDLGFTFGVNEETLGNTMDKELNNGRLAMLGILGMMSQELVTHHSLF